jgi:thioredoxin reductase (NADPH)
MTPPADVNHTFPDAEIEELIAFGTVESYKAGDLILAEGSMAPDCIITLSGHTDIFAATDEGSRRVGWMERGQFAGDLSILTGQRHLSRVEMGADGDILRIPHDNFQRLIAGNSHFSDVFVRVFAARREFGNSRGFAAIIVIGAAMDRSVYAMRDLLMKHGVAHRWFDPADGPVAGHLMAERGLTEDDERQLMSSRRPRRWRWGSGSTCCPTVRRPTCWSSAAVRAGWRRRSMRRRRG